MEEEEKEEGEEKGEQQEKEEEEAEEKEEAPGVATQKNDQVEPAILTIHPGNKKNVDGLVKVVALPKLCFRLPASRGASIGELFTIHALFVSGVGGWMQLEWSARVSR